jgi:hypothetical protein
VDVQSTGGGEATHLGRFTATFHALVTIPAGTAVGEFTFVAANGDRLFATFTGQSTPTSVAGVVSIHEIATITGGTGRFADATGSFTIDRSLNQGTHVSSGSFSGTIDLSHWIRPSQIRSSVAEVARTVSSSTTASQRERRALTALTSFQWCAADCRNYRLSLTWGQGVAG